MKKIWFFLNIFFCICFVSCTSVRTFSIDYMLPAEINLPAEVRTVAVVNNLSGKPGARLANSGQESDYSNSGVYLGDGKIAAEALAQNIAEGNYFDQVIICDSALRANDSYRRTSSLASGEIEKLTQDLGADMIISLEGLGIKTDRGVLYGPGYVMGTLDATVGTVVKLYVPSRQQALATCMDQDSIYWVTGSSTLKNSMLEEASVFAASLPIKRLVPTWTTSDRFYYDGGCVEMRDAAVYCREQSWDDAFVNWKKVYDTKKNKLKMCAAFNMGLYYELQDNFEEAMRWVTEACKMCVADKDGQGNVIEAKWPGEYKLAVYYLSELSRREKDLQQLNVQMNRFDDEF